MKTNELIERASKGYPQKFKADENSGIVWAVGDNGELTHAFDVRGWGNLTGTGGGMGLSNEEAIEIQDAMKKLAEIALNNFMPMLEALEEAQKMAILIQDTMPTLAQERLAMFNEAIANAKEVA